MAQKTTYRDLYETVQRRVRPEDVAQMILDLREGDLDQRESRQLNKAARRSARRLLSWSTSMLEDFARPAGLERQVRVAETLFEIEGTMTTLECTRPEAIEAFLRVLGEEIRKGFGYSDYKYHRLNRELREASGLGDMSRRRYNKLFRLLARMEGKLETLVQELKKYEFTRIGKSGLATQISLEAFTTNANTACFIAYFVARQNLRSEFTVAGQARPFDEISEMLFERCLKDDQTNWFALAMVFPDERVLKRLDEGEKGALLARWFGVLKDVAGLLRKLWESSDIDRSTMIVRRGNDSTTWNNTANAWNQARRHWIALLYAMGCAEILDVLCPGKVLRLMAADVVAWHGIVGNGLDPDTRVWQVLPLPWEVLSGSLRCTLSDVRETCRRHGVNPVKRGWIEPVPTKVTSYRPTPELVHGVAVADPELARTLRKAGWFSGKSARDVEHHSHFDVRRDPHGFVTGVENNDDTR